MSLSGKKENSNNVQLAQVKACHPTVFLVKHTSAWVVHQIRLLFQLKKCCFEGPTCGFMWASLHHSYPCSSSLPMSSSVPASQHTELLWDYASALKRHMELCPSLHFRTNTGRKRQITWWH